MSEAIEIEGWRCRVVRGQRSAQNYALEMGAWLLPDGRLKTEGLETDGGPVNVTVPAVVLAWLVAPALRDAWDRGHSSGARDAGCYMSEPDANPYSEIVGAPSVPELRSTDDSRNAR